MPTSFPLSTSGSLRRIRRTLWFWGLVGLAAAFATFTSALVGVGTGVGLGLFFLLSSVFASTLLLIAEPLAVVPAGIQTSGGTVPWAEVLKIQTFRGNVPFVRVHTVSGRLVSVWMPLDTVALDDALDSVAAHWRSSGIPVRHVRRYLVVSVLEPDPAALGT